MIFSKDPVLFFLPRMVIGEHLLRASGGKIVKASESWRMIACSADSTKGTAHLDLSLKDLLSCLPWTLNCPGREISKSLMNS